MDEHPPIAIEEQIACVEREIRMRQRVYPRWVANGKMPATKAKAEIATMEAVLRSLQAKHVGGRLI